jgi:hypothetical protein
LYIKCLTKLKTPMKAILKVEKSKFNLLLDWMYETAEIHSAEEREAHWAGNSDRRIGSGSFSIYPDKIIYCTGSNKGLYTIKGSRVIFEGRRRSFKDGTEYFRANPKGLELYTYPDTTIIEGSWEILESSQPDRGLWD